MFIAIIGTRSSGKGTVKEYLNNVKQFTLVRLMKADADGYEGLPGTSRTRDHLHPAVPSQGYRPVSFLMMNSPTTPSFSQFSPNTEAQIPRERELTFHSHKTLLDYVTQNWRSDFVTVDLDTYTLLDAFKTRPFFVVVSVDAPILTRYQRSLRVQGSSSATLEEFVQEHDDHFYGTQFSGKDTASVESRVSSLRHLHKLVDVHVNNAFDTISQLHSHLEALDITNPERLRPSWDTYFMELASLASLRSNCMKRRVGAILVRNKRILSTGYNGTPRGLTNCNEGGCTRCNSANETSDECVCLHAEENALLEAGRERVGDNAVLYCNTCPCLKCTIKIIQTGVKEVVYNLSYKVDDASAALFKEAGVVLRRHAPPPEL